jgi:hypothetical protein
MQMEKPPGISRELGKNPLGVHVVTSPLSGANHLFIQDDRHLVCAAGE